MKKVNNIEQLKERRNECLEKGLNNKARFITSLYNLSKDARHSKINMALILFNTYLKDT